MSTEEASPQNIVLRSEQVGQSVMPLDCLPGSDDGDNEGLHSIQRPDFAAGTYNVNVERNTSKYNRPEKDTLADIPAAHRVPPGEYSSSFATISPQYSLPAGSVETVYPAPGLEVPHTTLPHVVFNNSSLPWDRICRESGSADEEKSDLLSKTRTPWLAVLVFTQDEITLPAQTEADLDTLLRRSGSEGAIGASPTFTYKVNMSNFINNIKGSNDISTPMTSFDTNIHDAKSTVGDIVCVKGEILQEFFRAFDDMGRATASQQQPDVSRYRWLAHIRHTTGLAQDGSENRLLGDSDTPCSVVVSHRAGPLGTSQPTSMIAHLVSIEGMEAMPFPFVTPYVALTSLHSWYYMSLPPDSPSLNDTLFNIDGLCNKDGNIQDQLLRGRVTKSELDEMRSSGDVGESMARRIEDGYTISKHQTRTGEETAVLYRGPLVPVEVSYPLGAHWDAPSTDSTSREILDPHLGIMDISYSSAWELGRTLALSEASFVVAVACVKRQIQKAGDNVATTEKSRQTLQLQLNLAAEEMGVSLQDASVPNDEVNAPRSADWATVLKWVLDRMYLVDIPFSHMVSDPSYLPLESIRFFAIDRNWTDSLIDGALSLTKHHKQSGDMVTRAIKHALKRYLATDRIGLGRRPPVPRYGFLLRSELVAKFPDMEVEIGPHSPGKPAPLIRRELLDTNVMMCLFDQPPTEGAFESITLSQSPHHTSFSIAASLSSEQINVCLKTAGSLAIPNQLYGNMSAINLSNSQDVRWDRGEKPTENKPVMFVWDKDDLKGELPFGDNPALRFLNVNFLATWAYITGLVGMNSDVAEYTKSAPTSSLVAHQLSDTKWQIKIDLAQQILIFTNKMLISEACDNLQAANVSAWNWLHPYNGVPGQKVPVPGHESGAAAGESEQTRFMPVKMGKVDSPSRFEPGPYTAIEGYLQLRKYMADDVDKDAKGGSSSNDCNTP
ncbi:hypothetical protein G7054_g8016 [Neopestalotiopsis clavispora]|nr:hypothetical protein G7054_g8016 [Neopestalotiopsis clavispora]